LGCSVWHAPGELARDSGSMSLGTSLLQGSHLGSNRTGDDEGGCIYQKGSHHCLSSAGLQ
jgi:hypothetical protein